MAVDYEEDLEWFVLEMKLKLDINKHKGTWKNDAINRLFDMLEDEVNELFAEITELEISNENIIKECADIANFAMFIAERAKSCIK